MPHWSRPPILVGVILWFLAACTPAAPVTIPTDTAAGISATTPSPSHTAPAATATHARKPAPSRTAAPEPTDIPPLPPEGPYFAFIDQKRDASVLTLLGTDGIGRKEIPLPEDAETGNCSSCIISPDGEWLAYWTGFAGEPSYNNPPPSEGPFDLQLNLLHIPDGITRKIASLLSPDYPANFVKNAEAVKNLPQFQDDDVTTVTGYLWDSFLDGIRSAAWSPDGRYLAFAGEMDGPSSDLYVFDTSRQSIRRLSGGPKNILSGGGPAIRWSPDGKWIVYSCGFWVSQGMTLSFYAARPDGSQTWEFPDEVQGFIEWGSPSVFLISQGENGVGNYGLRTADLETGALTLVWRCPFQYFAYDPEGRILIMDMSGDWSMDCPNPGLSLREIPSLKTILFIGLEDPRTHGHIAFLGQGNNRFLAYAYDSGSFAITSQGEALWITRETMEPQISPDRRWIAFTGEGFRLMDIYGNMSEVFSDIPVTDLLWRPDSKGFLIRSGEKLYSASVPEGSVVRIEGEELPSDVSEHSYALKFYWRPDSTGIFMQFKDLLYFISFRNQSIHLILNNIPSSSFDPLWVAIPG